MPPEELERLKELMEEARAYWELQEVLLKSATPDEREATKKAASEALQEFDRAANAYLSALP